MKLSEAINRAVSTWKGGVRDANRMAMQNGHPYPPLTIREAIASGCYIAVSVQRDCGTVTSLCAVEHNAEDKRLMIVVRALSRAVPILELPSPFNALALSEGDQEIVAEIPELGTSAHFRARDADL